MTPAQARLLGIIRQYGEYAEYWPVVNDWLKGDGQSPLALRNINRTVTALVRDGHCYVNDDGLFVLGRRPVANNVHSGE